MTGPNTWGIGSPIYQQELEASQQNIQNSFNKYSQMIAAMRGQQPGSATMVPQGQQVQPAGPHWEDEDLVGAGMFWGLPEQMVRQMPRQAVIDFVNQHRQDSRAGGINEIAQDMSRLAMFGVGAGEAVTSGLQHLPLIGQWMSERSSVRWADLQLRQLEEGIRASNPESEKNNLSVANVAGNLAATLYPGSVAWSLAGNVTKVMPIVSKLSPIGRAAFQGGLSSYLLAGGTKDTDPTADRLMHVGEVVGAGALLGGLFQAVEKPVGDLVARVTRSFVSPTLARPAGVAGTEQLGPGQASGPVQGPYPSGAMEGPNMPPRMVLEQAAAGGDEQARVMLQYLDQQGQGPGGPPSDGGGGGFPAIQHQPDFSPQVGRAPEPPSFGPQTGLASDISPFAPAPGGSPAGTPFEDWTPQVGQMRGPDNLPRVGLDLINQSEYGETLIGVASMDRSTRQVVSQVGFEGGHSALPGVPESWQSRQAQWDDGFVTSTGRFVNREQGLELARARDQLRRAGSPRMRGGGTYEGFDATRTRLEAGDVVSRAEALTVQMNKAASVVSSPDFPSLSGQALLDDATVGRAVIAENPGGSNVVQGVGDPGAFVQGLGTNVAFARRGQRLDALISDVPLSPQAVGQYETFGMYTGQRVLTSDGVAGTIEGIGLDGEVLLNPIYAGTPMRRPIGDLHPLVSSPGKAEVPQLWDMFQVYADVKATAVQQAMGGGLGEGQAATVRTKNMAQWMEDFLDYSGITQPGDRSRVREYFNERWVDSFKSFAPREIAQGQVATATANAEIARTTLPVVQQLDQSAATKGFRVIPVDESQWIVEDMVAGNKPQPNPTTVSLGASRVTFESREAAETYVRNFDRTGSMPDITPDSPVPLEIIPKHPTEPTQAPNLNEQTPIQTAASIAEMDAAPGGVGGDLPPTETLVAEGRHGQLQNRWIQKFMRWQPARRLVSRLDEGLFEHTGQDWGIASMWEGLNQKLVQHHNDQNKYFDGLADIFVKFRNTKHLVDGTWTRIYEILDPAQRASTARTAGFTDREIATFDEFNALMRTLFPQTQLDPGRELAQYISHIAQRQSRRETLPGAFDDFPLTESTQPFYEHVRTGNLNFREMDPRTLGEIYIRAVTWKKNMAPDWDAAVESLRTMKATGAEIKAATGDDAIEQVAGLMKNQIGLIKHGYDPTDDLALDTAHAALHVLLGETVTRDQARQLFGMGMNSIHSGMLGFRPSVIARDLLQVFLAVPRAGHELLGVYSKWMKDPEFRKAAWKAAVDEGAVQLQMPRMASPSSLGGELQVQAARPTSLGQGDASWQMRGMAKISAAVREHMPEWLRDTRDSWFHPMYLYGKQAEMTRAMVYTAGKDKARAAIANYRAQGSVDMAGLMGESSARTFDPAWQRQFQNLVAAGADTEAEQFLGRQLAMATQFDYGVVHSPWVAKSMTGRVAMQFGNYPMQYFQFLRESTKNGQLSDHVKLFGLAAATFGALGYGSRKTGWNFRWMNPWSGLGFTGGPLIQSVAAIGAGARQAQNTLTNPDAANTGLITQGIGAVGDVLSYANPARGLWTTAQGLGQAMDSPYPGQAVARHFITGETGPGPDINNWLMPQAEASFQRSLQPQSNPVRGNSVGLPPGSFPQQPVTVPPVMQNPQQIPGAGQSTGVDTSEMRFGPPAPDRSSVYGYQDVVAAFRGDPAALGILSPDERQVLGSLRGVPVEIAMQQFRGYLNQKLAAQGSGVAPGGIRP